MALKAESSARSIGDATSNFRLPSYNRPRATRSDWQHATTSAPGKTIRLTLGGMRFFPSKFGRTSTLDGLLYDYLNNLNLICYSEWSEVLNVTTMGAAPSPPAPPVLQHATPSTLSLSWCKPATEQIFTLQLSDPFSGHGFLNVYHGPDNEYNCCGLVRNTSYRFRVTISSQVDHFEVVADDWFF
jgi:hypothetical protein